MKVNGMNTNSDIKDRCRSSQIFALADIGVLTKLAKRAVSSTEKVRMLQEPAMGLVMMEARDPVTGQSFYVGEVLVTSCQIEMEGLLGCAVVLGDDPDRAESAAILDAALQQPNVAEGLLKALVEEERRVEANRRAEWALVARTRVQLETLEDRDANSI